ncbi:MAG: GNAT family N-acetyltransferase [Rhodothermales bacterium]|nr:GNAT family N-acetyltransferase [Rhodothermales bacterium]
MASSGCIVRRAGLHDIDALTLLFDGYRVFYEQEPDPDAAREFIGERLRNEDSVILLAEDDDGRALGFTQLYPMFSSVRMRRIWILNDLFVATYARRRGAAHALLKAAAEHARRSGAAGLELATAHDNHAAKSVYENLGWTLDTEFDHYSMNV